MTPQGHVKVVVCGSDEPIQMNAVLSLGEELKQRMQAAGAAK